MTTALVIAHPGHELRLAAWVRAARPRIFIIAKGSRAGRSEARIEASRKLAANLHAKTGEPFGAAYDTDLYAWVLAGDPAPFAAMTDRLRDQFIDQKMTLVVTDAWQNYNPVHDLTHLMARVAAAEAGLQMGRVIDCVDYPVVLGGLAHAPIGPEWSRISLDPNQVATKLSLALRYPEIADDLSGFMEVGLDSLAVEALHALLPMAALAPSEAAPPWYEVYGEGRVREGVYSSVLRWRHMLPIVTPLRVRLATIEAAIA